MLQALSACPSAKYLDAVKARVWPARCTRIGVIGVLSARY